MTDEICGDIPLSRGDKMRYLAWNMARNVATRGPRAHVVHFSHAPVGSTHANASPSRALTEAFLAVRLPELLAPREVRILEVGCGSGRLASILANQGYTGAYLGIDIDDRFDRTPVEGLEKSFQLVDAHQFATVETFDLVVSISSLEHIADDVPVIRRLARLVAPGGLQLHFVPAGWGLPVYLWHGWRQYTLAAVSERFEPAHTTVHTLGGAFSFLVHFGIITLGELVGGMAVRRRHPGLYARLRDRALRMDRFLPSCATMLAICVREPAIPADRKP